MRDFQGVFALFPVRKKVRGGVRTRGHNWVRTLLHGLRRLMPSPWRAPTTWWRSRRRWRCPWRRWRWRTLRLALLLFSGPCGSARGSPSTSWDGPGGGCAYGNRCTFAHSWAELHPEASAHEFQLALALSWLKT